jgi:Cu(I)/Ag(I) efflux system outer membrane protein
VEKADRLPGLEAEGQKSVTGGAAMPTRRSYEALIALPAFELDFFGRLKNLSASALEQYLATEEAALTARLALVAEVASAYLDSRLAWERLRLTEANRKSWRSSLAFIEERARSGQARLLDLEQARGMLEFAEANLADRRTEIVRAENALKFLTGYFEDQELPEPLALQNWSPATLPEAVPSTVLLQRPDVLEAEHQLKAALADIGVARAAFFPRLALTGSYGLMSGELGNRFTGSAAAWNFTPSLNLPLFAGGRNRANLDLAETRRETAVIQYEKVIQAAFRETADALLTRESRQRQFEAQRQYLATQRRVRELAVNQYQSGTVSYLEVLEAQRDVFEAEMTLLELRREQLANEINLYLALGGGLETADPPAAPAAAPQGEKL